MYMQQIQKGKSRMARVLLLLGYFSSLGILATIVAIIE